MKVEFNDEGFKEISQLINDLPKELEDKQKTVCTKIGKIIVDNVKKALPRSDTRKKHAADGTSTYKHMRDDVKMTVKQRSGFSSITVGGGKLTAYKWHLLDDGTMTHDGRPHTKAIHFTSTAMKTSKAEIDLLIDNMIAEVASGGH